VKREDFINSFDRIKPDNSAKRRMLDNILSHSGKERKTAVFSFNIRKAVPALSLAVALTFGFLAYDIIKDRENVSPPGVTEGDAAAREDMAAPLINQFQIDDRNYISLSEDLKQEYGFPQEINESDIGDRIVTISKSADPSLIGCEVYAYKPAGSEAVVAVKKNGEYILFRFFTFESYQNNQDEDAAEYLKLYGINKPEDISKIQFIIYSDQNKINGRTEVRELTGRDEIARFYGYFSGLKNASDKYFDKLFSFRPAGNTGTDVEIDIIRERELIPPDAGVPVPVEPVAPGSIVPVPDKVEVAGDTPLMMQDDPVSSDFYKDMPVSSDGSAGMASGGSAGAVSAGSASSEGAASGWKGRMDMGGTEPTGEAVAPSTGLIGDALADPIGVRIYNKNGVYFEIMYYRNIGFMQRYEVNEEFAAFMDECIR